MEDAAPSAPKAILSVAALRRWWPWIALALAVIVGLLAVMEQQASKTRSETTRQIAPTTWTHSQGFLYIAPIPELAADTDSNEKPQNSPWVLLENGKPMGTPHSAHQSIIEQGKGLYSHWQGSLYASTSDNTDPSHNGRIYHLRKSVPPNYQLAQTLGVVAAILGVVGIGGAFWSERRRLSPTVATMAMNVIVALVVLWAFTGIETRSALDTTTASHVDGAAWSVPLPAKKDSADTNSEPHRSELRLYENGVALGPPHSLHADIIARGGGRYSHWDTGLIISASDNSDVRRNFRSYELVEVLRPPLWLTLGVLAAWLAALTMDAGRRAGGIAGISGPAIRDALVRSGAVAMALAGFVALAIGIVTSGAADPDAAVAMLNQVRQAEQGIVAPVFAIAAAFVLTLSVSGKPLLDVARIAAGALLVAMVLYGVSDHSYGLADQSPVMFFVLLAAAAVGLAVRLFAPAVRDTITARAVAALPPAYTHMRLAIALCCALTLIQLLPEVTQYWDQSGWADSDSYDRMGHDIARGMTPAGNSTYPPGYQYGLAAVYWTFGHFFFVQQLANLLLALVTTGSLCLAAWLLYRNLFVVWLIGLFASHWEPLHHATWYTQIEGWYVPIFSLSLLALAWYLRKRTIGAAVVLGIAAGIVVATRQQGLFYAAGLGLAVFAAHGLAMGERLRQLLIVAAAAVLVGVLPWSLRNYAVEGRLSPSSNQSVEDLAIYNDSRIPLYGIRYWQNAPDVAAEWKQRYPDEQQRHKAMDDWFVDRVLHHFDFFTAAAPWRMASFYGLLPNGVIYGTSTMQQFWANPLPDLLNSYRFWAPLLASLIGLAFAFRERRAWLLAVLTPANVAIGLIVSTAEPRLCYPVLALNMLLALAIVTPMVKVGPREQLTAATEPVRGRNWLAVATTAVIAAALLHVLLGEPNMERPIKSANYRLAADVSIDRALPEVKQTLQGLTVDGAVVKALVPGLRYRTQVKIGNSQFPPRYAIGLRGVDPGRYQTGAAQYFKTVLPMQTPIPATLGLRFEGVFAQTPLRENMTIDAEIVVDSASDVFEGYPLTNWVRVDKAVRVAVER